MSHNIFLETIRCDAGVAHHLSYHQQRLDATLKKCGIKGHYPLKKLINPPDTSLYRCRFVYSSTGYTLEYLPYLPRKISTLRLIHDDTIDYSCKYVDRTHLDALYAQRNGCDDVLIIKNNYITETTIANIALWIDNQWLTPEHPLLHGTTRERLIGEKIITTAPLSMSDLKRAKKMMLMNAMIGCIELENGIIG